MIFPEDIATIRKMTPAAKVREWRTLIRHGRVFWDLPDAEAGRRKRELWDREHEEANRRILETLRERDV